MNITAISAIRTSTPPHNDIGNLLQVAASALHLLDLALDDELRPLVRAGLNAIRQAADGAPAILSAPMQTMRIS